MSSASNARGNQLLWSKRKSIDPIQNTPDTMANNTTTKNVSKSALKPKTGKLPHPARQPKKLKPPSAAQQLIDTKQLIDSMSVTLDEPDSYSEFDSHSSGGEEGMYYISNMYAADQSDESFTMHHHTKCSIDILLIR